MNPPLSVAGFLTCAVLLASCASRPASRAGPWEASSTDLRFHKGLSADTRSAVYAAVLVQADSIVIRAWGTPDSWARLQGRPTTGAANTLCLDPGIRSASLLAARPPWEAHDLTWAVRAASSRPFVGFCSLDATTNLATNGAATMAISLSTISPLDSKRVLVHLSMRRAEPGNRGFASEWLITLTGAKAGWVVSHTRMEWIN